MEYKVVPLAPNFTKKTASLEDAADYLEKFINHYEKQGWRYIRVEVMTTYVVGDTGCFGIGAKPGYHSNKQLVVFSKS